MDGGFDERTARADMAAKGFEKVVLVEWAPGHFNDRHSHDWPVYVWVLDGSMEVETEGGKVVYKKGDLLTLPKGRPHIERIGPNGIRLLSARG